MGVMRMGNIVPRAGIEPTSLAFQVSVLTITLPRLHDVTMLPMPSMGSLLKSSVQTTTTLVPLATVSLIMLTITYTGNGLTYTYTYTGYVQQPYSMQLVQDPGHGTSGVGVMKMGNMVPRAGIEPTSLAFWASVLTISPSRFPGVNMPPTPTCLCVFLAWEVSPDTRYYNLITNL